MKEMKAMKRIFRKNRLAFMLVIGFLNLTAIAQEGATLFKPCAACHSIGGGRMVGPDLKGITKRRSNEWLLKFVKTPADILKSGDADAKAVFQEFNNVPMPNNALTDEQINQILAYIDGSDSKSAVAINPEEAALQHKIDSILKTNSPQDIRIGQALFNGLIPFENGGAPCMSCHNATSNKTANGGTLARDLTKAYTRLGGSAGIKGVIASPPFPSMAETYKNNPVTHIENAYIQLFLKDTDSQNTKESIVTRAMFVHITLIISVLLIVVISLIWFKRKRRSVNDAILKRQLRYSK